MLSTTITDALFDECQKCLKREIAFIFVVVVTMFATITFVVFFACCLVAKII